MPLMGSLYIGSSGLQTSQNALNTTAHNLTNIDTVGYTRQQVMQADKSYIRLSTNIHSVANQQYGLGTNYSIVKQVRDYFLDKSYRKESGRSMFYEVSSNVMSEIEDQLGELNGEAFQGALSDYWTSVQELAKDPCSSVTQSLFVQKASEFVERAEAVYDGLCSYQDNLNQQVYTAVDQINEYGNQLLELNDKIRAIEAGGIEHANDLRDARNDILDNLGELANIRFAEDAMGNVSVQIEGVDFVKGSMCYEIAMDEDPATGFYTPFWPMNASFTEQADGTRIYNIDGAEVFDFSIEISSDFGTDIGKLKAMVLARGDHRADYTDINTDYDSVAQSVLMNVQAEFDQLVHSVSTKVNSILAEAAGVKTGQMTLDDGTTEEVSYAMVDKDGYLRAEDGSPMQLFTKAATPGYVKMTAEIDGVTDEYWVYVEEDPNVKSSLYSVRNIEINQELVQRPAALGFRLKDGSEDLKTMDALKEAFTEEIYNLNPNVMKKTNLVQYYNDLVSQVANSGYVYNSIYDTQQNTVESIQAAREQIVGVSSDEELSYMIKFQNAYNASSRYINVISEMLEHIITTLGS